MRIVVTGATGNIGTALLRRWRPPADSQGVAATEVVGIARRLPDTHTPGVRWVSADLSREESLPILKETVEGADAVVHLAWGFQPSHNERYLEALGVGGTRRVLEAVGAARVPHLVHMSSLGAYAPRRTDTPIDESWPTTGVPTSMYSRHKVAAERLLDAFEQSATTATTSRATTVTRLRPGVVGQRSAGSALLRYGVPEFFPAKGLNLVRALPVDRGLVISAVHADDVAAAVDLVLRQRAGGAFNLAADPPVSRDSIAEALHAKPLHVPSALVRLAVSVSWHARLQQLDPGWVDLAFALPLLDSGKARRDLGWRPTHDAASVIHEVVDGMRDTASAPTPVLRERSLADNVRQLVSQGPVARRERP